MDHMYSKIDAEYRKCVGELYSIAPSFQRVGKAGYHPGLDVMSYFMEFLDFPHRKFKSVHVAGTNGKGSVCHFLASALAYRYPGAKIGLYTSPHLLDFRERIKVVCSVPGEDGKCHHEISKEDTLDFMERAGSFIRERHPSFFEITTAMAFDYFARENVDIAIIETGLGGRLDSTNVLSPQLSIITSIGLDHKDILGGTIEEIAREKAGIIKNGVPVVIGQMPEEAEVVMRSTAQGTGSSLYRAGELCSRSMPAEHLAGNADLKSDCQVRNINTVLTALRLLNAGCVEEGSRMQYGMEHAASVTGLRGRWEKLCDSPEVICDIGHNAEALSFSMEQLRRIRNGRKMTVVYGMASDKDIESAGRLLIPDVRYIFTQAEGSRAMPADKLKQIIEYSFAASGTNLACADSVAVGNVSDAVSLALEHAGPEDIIFIGGSSYVVAEAIGYFEENFCNKKVFK